MRLSKWRRTEVAQGARRLHLVDLNVRSPGKPVNKAAIQRFWTRLAMTFQLQIGGSIRDLKPLNATSIWASATSSSVTAA